MCMHLYMSPGASAANNMLLWHLYCPKRRSCPCNSAGAMPLRLHAHPSPPPNSPDETHSLALLPPNPRYASPSRAA